MFRLSLEGRGGGRPLPCADLGALLLLPPGSVAVTVAVEAYLQKELEAIRARRSPAEATIARLNGSALAPANPEEFAATCEALRERVEEEVEAGRLKGVAEAM